MPRDRYQKYKAEAIQKSYKKCPPTKAAKMISEEKKIAEELALADGMEIPSKAEGYLTLKDHKTNYRNNPTFRLLNGNKSESGKVAKLTLKKN